MLHIVYDHVTTFSLPNAGPCTPVGEILSRGHLPIADDTSSRGRKGQQSMAGGKGSLARARRTRLHPKLCHDFGNLVLPLSYPMCDLIWDHRLCETHFRISTRLIALVVGLPRTTRDEGRGSARLFHDAE